MRSLSRWIALLAFPMVVGCTRPRTQLVVAVDTDMTWGPTGALRAVQITVRSNDPEGQLRDRRVVELGDATPLPASFGVVPLDDDPSRRVWIEVRGCGESGCDAPLVTRQAYVGFVEGQTLLLQMTLAGVCRRVECPDATQTCLPSTGSCGSAQVEASTLSAWTGQLPRVDAGKAMDVEALDVTDGGESADASPGDAIDGDEGGDVPGNDVGATEDRPSIVVGSGDGAVDAPEPIDVGADVGCAATCGGACVDLQSDPNHCGNCDRACTTSRANSVGACVTGSCVVRCAEGYGDCDANPANGCEVDLRASAAHCGSCGSTCAVRPGATAVCVDGACGFTCDTGAADCDGNATNGCEATLATNATHCGACGRACRVANATAACVGGTCAVGACASGFGDCDRDAANGCERGLTADAANCGACGRVCSPTNATGACVAGACRVGTCATGFGDCDGDAANGCERDLRSDTANCGMCGRACAAGDYCVMGACRGPMPAIGDLRTNIYAAPEAIGTDAVGNIYIVGVSYGEDLGSGLISGQFVASATSSGIFRWARSLPTRTVNDIAVDHSGNSTFFIQSDRPDFGSGALPGNGTFSASYSNDGTLRWARFLGDGRILDVSVAASSGVVVFATGLGSLDFGAGPVSGPAIVQMSSGGSIIRSRPLPVLEDINTHLSFISSSSAGSVCITFYTTHAGPLDLGGGPLARAGSEGGNLIVACYNSELRHQWSRRIGPLYIISGERPSITQAENGSLFMSGIFSTVNDAAINLECAPTSPFRSSLAIINFDSMGLCSWGHFFTNAQTQTTPLIKSDSSSNVYIAGSFNPPSGVTTISLGSGSLPARSSFVASYDATGSGRWSTAFTSANCSSGFPSLTAMDLAGDRSIITTGRFGGRALLFSTETPTVSSCSDSRMYLLRISQ